MLRSPTGNDSVLIVVSRFKLAAGGAQVHRNTVSQHCETVHGKLFIFNLLGEATPFHGNTVLKLLCDAPWQTVDSEEIEEGFTVAQPKIAKTSGGCFMEVRCCESRR
jgi:hypothetical protein